MGGPLELVTDGSNCNPKVWETTNLFQLHTSEDIFSLGWIVFMQDGDNFAFGRIKFTNDTAKIQACIQCRSD